MNLEPGRILLLQPRWMGDVLLCTPAIRAAREAFPSAQIDFVTERPGAEVLRQNPHVDEVLVAERGIGSRLRLWARIARSGYDAVVDFRSTNSTAQLTALSRASIRVGIRGRGPRNLAYTRLVDRPKLTQYAARHKLDMLSGIGVPVHYINDLSLELHVSTQAREWARELWVDRKLEGQVVVGLTPVSREPYKQWSATRWAAVADRIGAEGARVVVTHGPGERERVQQVLEAMRTRPVWGLETSVERLAAVLERCDLWVGNDGGTKHVAVAVDTPTIAVSRWQIGPVWTDATSPVSHSFIDQAPPGGCDLRCERCSHLGCLAAVEVDDVIGRIRVALSAHES